MYADGHAKFRQYRSMRSGDYGLTPDEGYQADQKQAYCNAAGSCGGVRYNAAF
jgi:hypothetical protein